MKKVQSWEIIGILIIIGFGTTLHFWFEWTDYWRPMALIAAVNESTWEHFKMAFWPALIYALIEYPFIKDDCNNFALAKFAGLFTMPIITMILFYGYTALTGTHMLWVDVVVFILSVIGGQIISDSDAPVKEIDTVNALILGEKTIPDLTTLMCAGNPDCSSEPSLEPITIAAEQALQKLR